MHVLHNNKTGTISKHACQLHFHTKGDLARAEQIWRFPQNFPAWQWENEITSHQKFHTSRHLCEVNLLNIYTRTIAKNLGRLWLANRTSGRFYMLQLISVDSRHFTQPGSGLALTPVVIGKDHGHMLIKSAQHSLAWSSKTHCLLVGRPFAVS